MAVKRPLNKQVIVFFWDGVNKGLFGKGDFVKLIDIRGACQLDVCENEYEHLTFDGQFFYRRKK